ncbi:MAG: DegT/DnrJ/EryC1/StrS family aminotransferase [Phycisphaerales bacterium]|nr:DegT/DnrJ/EryC1/StrS family aminotransferase [Phycisphaerae bacterium]NNF42474.1 DegT/DnrJ/EryC1/StrS family aminotransferase [Phycisphaerales bacterium]NNM26067.1 DegT/DnrJ/EryC1/StrS family aminotransferase [Phycisphaerales bacterium]
MTSPSSLRPNPPQRRGGRPFLVYGAPVIETPEIDEVVDSLRSGWLGTGPKVARFERTFAAYKNAPHAVAVNSCTAALHLSLVAAGLGPGDEVITTPLTFCATINAIIHAGATPVLADVDPETMNLDPVDAARRITPRTRAIVPVHFAGRPCELAPLTTLCRHHDLALIEDCAHAIETRAGGTEAGTAGDFGCFSFYVTKNLCTGEGGMILPRTAEAAARVKRLALHGLSADAWSRFSDRGYRHYAVVEPGFKYNMTDLQAAIGIHQLARIEPNHRHRETVWTRYQDALCDQPVIRPTEPAAGTRHAYHLYAIRIPPDARVDRDAFIAAMYERGVGTGVHYRSVAEHPCYQQRFGWRPEAWPHAFRIGRETVSLPLSAGLSDQDVDDVITATRDALGDAAPRCMRGGRAA